MKKIMILMLAIAASACTTLSATPGFWKRPTTGAQYQFTAQMQLGIFSRTVTVSVNGKSLMVGKARYWAQRITIPAVLDDGTPAVAECTFDPNQCAVSVSGEVIAELKF